MDLFIPVAAVAKTLRWTAGDLRAVRRCLKPPLPVQRGLRRGSGRTPDCVALVPLLHWLQTILPNGVDDDLADALTAQASPIV